VETEFWVQYGPHTMLWFSFPSGFCWLNNPVPQQAERNFLIKLAVNFVHDLYKPNVRGYQVTQCRTKGCGRENGAAVQTGALDGPTIAAALDPYNQGSG
jgi:hypothetical protein